MKLIGFILVICLALGMALADPLRSWFDGEIKSDLVAFVDAVGDIGGTEFRAQSKKVAVVHNDGALRPEQAAYLQFLFTVDRITKMVDTVPKITGSPTVKTATADSDVPILQWVTTREGRQVGLLVHDTNETR